MVKAICQQAKQASYTLVKQSEQTINRLLLTIAHLIESHQQAVLEANQKDIATAKANGINDVMLDRLMLDKDRLLSIAASVRTIAELPSPVDQPLAEWRLYNGVTVKKQAVPFGVVAIIYESRPNVTIDAAVIALKAKNAVVLKGGKAAIHSNAAFVNLMKEACQINQLPADLIGFIHSVDRQDAAELLTMKGLIDLLIPRGSAGLINWVTANAKVPVIETGAGNCHLFVDRSANFEMAMRIIENAKTQRPSVCNAVEKVLVHRAIAAPFISALREKLAERVTLKAHHSAAPFLQGGTVMQEDELYSEFLDYVLGIIVVDDVEQAINWINQYSSHHSDGILTEDLANAELFQTVVDSAAVYHNASTRFTDGGEFGFGAEIGIATSKLHARGPMALKEMTTYKYLLTGKGQIR